MAVYVHYATTFFRANGGHVVECDNLRPLLLQNAPAVDPRSQMQKSVNHPWGIITVLRVTVTVCIVKVVYCKLCGCSTSLKYLLKCKFPATFNLNKLIVITTTPA